MSEVNQAFLRAYLKNRTAQSHASSTSAPPSHEPSLQSPPQRVPPQRAHANASRNAEVSQVTRALPSGANLRFDSSHANSQPSSNASNPPQPVERAVERPGVWTPLGAERGMKALEPKSAPAVVRNGIESVSTQAAQSRRPVAPLPAPTAPMPAQAPVGNGQVQYIDGLSIPQTPAPTIHRPVQSTLDEIGAPIEFSTGSPAPSPLPHARKSVTTAPPIKPPIREEELPAKSNRILSDDGLSNRRIDGPHGEFKAKEPLSKSAPLQEMHSIPLPVAFTPSWEVDQFFWPEVIAQIETCHADAVKQIGKHLQIANRDGLKVMAVTSGERGVGRSTVAMYMARCAASAGLRVALVDGDVFCPSLIDQLRLDMQHGWQDCLFENIPLEEVAVHSVEDHITLFPLTTVISQQQMHANLHRMAKLIRRISNAYDMVLIDANRLNLEQRDMVGVAQESIVDAAIVVVDTELSIKEKVDTAVSILQGMGLSSIGLVENFQS